NSTLAPWSQTSSQGSSTPPLGDEPLLIGAPPLSGTSPSPGVGTPPLSGSNITPPLRPMSSFAGTTPRPSSGVGSTPPLSGTMKNSFFNSSSCSFTADVVVDINQGEQKVLEDEQKDQHDPQQSTRTQSSPTKGKKKKGGKGTNQQKDPAQLQAGLLSKKNVPGVSQKNSFALLAGAVEEEEEEEELGSGLGGGLLEDEEGSHAEVALPFAVSQALPEGSDAEVVLVQVVQAPPLEGEEVEEPSTSGAISSVKDVEMTPPAAINGTSSPTAKTPKGKNKRNKRRKTCKESSAQQKEGADVAMKMDLTTLVEEAHAHQAQGLVEQHQVGVNIEAATSTT
ncbi:unnamed protein product, partial [Amoebophrya sp. A25]